jgi:PAS domain S-box-containing protein
VNGQSSGDQGGYGALDILDASQDCAWILRLDGSIEHVNQRAQAMFPAESIDLTNWRGIWPEESRFSLDRSFTLALTGQLARFRAFLGVAQHSRAYCDTTISPIRDRDGAVIRLLATARDVTQEVETQGFLKTVIQLLPSPLTVKNVEDGRYVLINRAAEDAFGIVADEAMGKTTREILSSTIAQRLVEGEAKVLRTGEMHVSEEKVGYGDDSAPRYFLTKTLATYDDVGARHLITLGEDVTARKSAAASLRVALEQAERASLAKSSFLANMSHEIRTPMNGVVAGADLLAKHPLPEASRELVGIIRNSAVMLERLLGDILDLARIEAGRVTVEEQPFHLGDLLRAVEDSSRLAMSEKPVDFTVTVLPELDAVVIGDPVRLRQVLVNLISNGAKFTERGAVSLTAYRDDDGAVRFCVADTGIGFDEGEKARIFERFQQADASITRRFGGSGLGLSISRELVALMGGELDCDSRPREGAQFWFSLPLPRTAAQTCVGADADTLESERAVRILLADDHPTNRRVVELMLADAAEVVSVENGREAVQAFLDGPIDVVLMDVQMPVMDGLSAVREIRRIEVERGSARAPIIMLTANAGDEHVAASRGAGADLHIEKPITSALLFAAIAKAFEAASAESVTAGSESVAIDA